jgi:hypothetical protein
MAFRDRYAPPEIVANRPSEPRFSNPTPSLKVFKMT